MILLVDNYDSFTYNLKDYLVQLGAEVEVHRNDKISLDQIKKGNYSGIVFSPGPGTPKDSGVCKEILKANLDLPLFGVCLGMQTIAEHFGSKVVKADYPMHGKVSELEHNGHSMFNDVNRKFEVCRYHSLIVDQLKAPLYTTATTDLGEIMALAHESKPIWAVQFHPEAILTTSGKQILANWIKALTLQ